MAQCAAQERYKRDILSDGPYFFIRLPGAVRAVGTAIGKNPIPLLIPCHRVIPKMGDFGNYGEGTARKKAILGWEAAMVSGEDKEK